jgi:hypothetical protein
MHKKTNEKVFKLYFVYRLVYQDIITINEQLTISTFKTVRKRKNLALVLIETLAQNEEMSDLEANTTQVPIALNDRLHILASRASRDSRYWIIGNR